MKLAFIGAAAVAAAAFVTPALAQTITSNPHYCAQFYPNARLQNPPQRQLAEQYGDADD